MLWVEFGIRRIRVGSLAWAESGDDYSHINVVEVLGWDSGPAVDALEQDDLAVRYPSNSEPEKQIVYKVLTAK